jgi:glucosylceramidase
MRAVRSFLLSSCLLAVAAAGGCAFDARGISAGDDSTGDDVGDDDVPAMVPDAQVATSADGAVDPRPDAAPAPPPPPTSAAVWLSTSDGVHRLARQPDLPLGDPGQDTSGAIVVDPADVGQVIDGFGAALTESSAWLLATRMSATQRHELLVRLFDREAGIGLRVLRLPLGASDFALSNYSYDDTAPSLADFSIAHDQQWILPVLHEIDALAPDLHRIAAPWSPPGWMKTSGSMIGGALKPGVRGMFAEYLVDALTAYEDEGLPIELLSIQNEPYNAPAGSPGMEMEPEAQAAILRAQLGPRLDARGLATRVLVWDHNWDDYAFATTVLADASARQYAAGTAFHCYLGDVGAQDLVHAAHPELGIWLTECSSGTWQGDYGASLRDDARLVIEATRHWARAVLKWNLVLDETRGPQNHGCSDCTGTVEVRKADGAVTFNAEYYVLGHFGKFVAPGAVRIGSTSGAQLAVEHVAFENVDGGIVVVALNPGGAAATFELRSTYGALTYVLPAGALVTFVIGGADQPQQ